MWFKLRNPMVLLILLCDVRNMLKYAFELYAFFHNPLHKNKMLYVRHFFFCHIKMNFKYCFILMGYITCISFFEQTKLFFLICQIVFTCFKIFKV